MASSPDSPLIRWGLVGTFAWVFTVVVYATAPGVNMQWGEPNLVGDYFAGALAPLAVFWVVVGFFQQSKALQQQQEALRLQIEEFKATNQQLVEAKARDLARVVPRFNIIETIWVSAESESHSQLAGMFIVNEGDHPALDVRVSFKRGASSVQDDGTYWTPEAPIPDVRSKALIKVGLMRCEYFRNTHGGHWGWFSVEFSDVFGNVHSQWFLAHFGTIVDRQLSVYCGDVDEQEPEFDRAHAWRVARVAVRPEREQAIKTAGDWERVKPKNRLATGSHH